MPGRRKPSDRYQPVVMEASPLRRADPRTKLLLSLCASLAVMLPLERLVVFLAGYAVFLGWARLLPSAARQVWRLKWILGFLFFFDWWLVSLSHAALIVMRLVLLAGVLTLLFGTTTPREFSLALERLRLPYRYAFSLVLAFQSLTLLDEEWRSIYEAQKARGIINLETGASRTDKLRRLFEQAQDFASLTVPAIVMTTQRAWSATEAAYARGFDSPSRRPYQVLRFQPLDWLLVSLALAAGIGLIGFH